MLPLEFSRRWLIAGVSLLLIVLVFALVPDIWPWGHGRGSEHFISDKVLHAATFAVLALWYTGQYAKGSYWWLALGLIGYGGFIEVCQSMTTYRTAEWGDLVADGIGIVTGMAVATTGTGGWSVRAEKWLKNRLG